MWLCAVEGTHAFETCIWCELWGRFFLLIFSPFSSAYLVSFCLFYFFPLFFFFLFYFCRAESSCPQMMFCMYNFLQGRNKLETEGLWFFYYSAWRLLFWSALLRCWAAINTDETGGAISTNTMFSEWGSSVLHSPTDSPREELGRCWALHLPNQGQSTAGVNKRKKLIKSKISVMQKVALLPLGPGWKRESESNFIQILSLGWQLHLLDFGSWTNPPTLKTKHKDGKPLQVIVQSRILRVASREQNKTAFTEINHVSFLLGFWFLVLIISAKQESQIRHYWSYF